MSFIALPEGDNVSETIRRLRAIDAEFFGTIYAARGTIGGNVTIEGSLTANDIYSADWDGTTPLALPDSGATAGWALQSSNGRTQFMGDMLLGADVELDGSGVIRTGPASGQHIKLDSSGAGNAISFFTGASTENLAGSLEGSDFSLGPGIILTMPEIELGTGELFTGSLLMGTDDVAQLASYGGISLLGQYDGGAFIFMTAESDNGDGDTGVTLKSWANDAAGAGDATLTLTSLADGSGAAYIFMTAADGIHILDGTVLLDDSNTPSLAFTGDTDTGLTDYAANTLGFYAGGATRWYVNSTYQLATTSASTGRIYNGYGAVGTPSYTTTNDQDTGWYWGVDGQWNFSSNGVAVAALTASGTTYGNAGLRIVGSTLGGTSGNRRYYTDFGGSVNGNSTYLEGISLRNTTGTGHSTMAIGFQRRTDTTNQASLWFTESQVGINTSDTKGTGNRTLTVNGTFAAAPGTTGTAANATWTAVTGSYYALNRFTSSKKYKREITYDVIDKLASYRLRPTKHWRIDDKEWKYGFILEDLQEEEPLLTNDETPDMMALISVLTAKIIKLEERVNELESRNDFNE